MNRHEHAWTISPRVIENHGETFGGRHIIGRDTRINGGIDVYSHRASAIVVDPNKYPAAYERLRDESLSRARSPHGIFDKHLLPGAVYDTVRANIRYSQTGVNHVQQIVALQAYGTDEFPALGKIELSEFINDGVGVCRHMGLVAGILLEMHVDAGLLGGKASVERNVRITPGDEAIAHQWARYTTSSGSPIIVDPAQGIYDSLSTIQQTLLHADPTVGPNGETTWIEYRRPEEIFN